MNYKHRRAIMMGLYKFITTAGIVVLVVAVGLFIRILFSDF